MEKYLRGGARPGGKRAEQRSGEAQEKEGGRGRTAARQVDGADRGTWARTPAGGEQGSRASSGQPWAAAAGKTSADKIEITTE